MPWLRAAKASSSMVMPVIAVLLRMGPYVVLRRTYDDGTRRASHTGLQPGRHGSWEGIVRVRVGLTALATVVLAAAVGCTSGGDGGVRSPAAATSTTVHHTMTPAALGPDAT